MKKTLKFQPKMKKMRCHKKKKKKMRSGQLVYKTNKTWSPILS